MIFFSYMYMVQHSVGIVVYFCYNTEYNKAYAKSIDKVINTLYSLWNKKLQLCTILWITQINYLYNYKYRKNNLTIY